MPIVLTETFQSSVYTPSAVQNVLAAPWASNTSMAAARALLRHNMHQDSEHLKPSKPGGVHKNQSAVADDCHDQRGQEMRCKFERETTLDLLDAVCRLL
jgi:hypothetical protein